MPLPYEYQRATDHFTAFMVDARNLASFGSTHQAYTMVQGVFQAFRHRLSLEDAIRFAGVLPAGLRALFVADWNPSQPQCPFKSRDAMAKDVRSVRPDHNFAPDNAISIVAQALRRHIDEAKFDAILEKFPDGAVEFWRP